MIETVMTVIIIQGLLLVAFFVFHIYVTNVHSKEIESYRKALLARNLAEYTASKISETPLEPVKIKRENIPIDELSDSEFNKHIEKLLKSE